MSTGTLPDWDDVVASAAHLQALLPEAVLVGGTASALYAQHRVSADADHVLTDLRTHFDVVLAQLEAVAGWQTARIVRPVLILGSLDGIETGIRQLIRTEPLDTAVISNGAVSVVLPTPAEMLRIKAILILRRNATRDYLDFVALAGFLGEAAMVEAMEPFDRLYPQPNGESARQQLEAQLASPCPYDLEFMRLTEYKHLVPELQDWALVVTRCEDAAVAIFEGCARLNSLG